MAFAPPHDNPHEQYLRVRVAQQTPGQRIADQVTVYFAAWISKEWVPVGRSADARMVLVETLEGEPVWETDLSGLTWCRGLLLCYGTSPPSLDGSRIHRHLDLGPNFKDSPRDYTLRTETIVDQKGRPHPEPGR